MAISLVFGLMSSSVLTVLALPAAIMVIDDIKGALHRLWTGRPRPDAANTAAAAAEGFRS
jgi:hypothetical protein